ncbi:DUF3263 domain-containing protein [Streptomyces erythrochromogenes]|uniref:DUF3263 domain-containing protein n=1 Tax=Streptomyces erythrochromogenes TaxID=285574 RepID=UPI00341958D4
MSTQPLTEALADSLSPLEKAMLEVESRTWQHPGPKERMIREHLGLNPVSYYQQLNQLIDRAAALEAAPGTVNRLRRIREVRRNNR